MLSAVSSSMWRSKASSAATAEGVAAFTMLPLLSMTWSGVCAAKTCATVRPGRGFVSNVVVVLVALVFS